MVTIFIYILTTVFVICSLLLTLVVLMQRPRSEGLGAAFGGGMTDSLFGAQTTDVLTKITIWLAGIFFACTLALAMLHAKADSVTDLNAKLKAKAEAAQAALANSGTNANGNGTANNVPAPVVRESLKVTLPNGIILDAYKGGVEEQWVAFLMDKNSRPGNNVWFDFDNLNFATGSNELTPDSMAQVKNIVAILKAFPKAKIKVGGYTDVTGSPETNQKLSQARAEVVYNAIKAEGANPTQLVGAEGYGSQFAKYPATAPDEDRRKDRRISLSPR